LDSTGKDSWKYTALCSLALTLAHGTRPETALVFRIVSLLTSIVLLFKFRKFFLFIAILIGVYAGQAYTSNPKVFAEESLGAFQIVEQELSQSATPKPVESVEGKRNESASAKCTQENQVIQLDDKEFRCKTSKTYQVIERSPTETLGNQISTTRLLEYKRNVNTLNAQSALPTSTCQNSTRDISRLIKCNLDELPYRLFAFLFRPLIFFDQGSATLTFAALENLGWMILVPLSIWVSLRKQEKTKDKLINIS